VLGAALPTIISICCAPVIVAVVSALRGWERLTARVAAALLLALGGVGLIAIPAGGWLLPANYAAGITWSLASAVLHAVVVLGNARMPARIPAVTASAWSMTAAALCMLPIAAVQALAWPASAADWLGMAYTGVVTTSVAYLLFAWGARRLGPTAAGVCTLVEPLVATLLAAWVFAQPLVPQQWLGALLLAAAMVLLTRS
jgi:DME family drug/metabolite transporter